jgi:hypothetical protein
VSTIDCAEFRDRAPELALGLIGGDERGAAIEHVARCAACSIHLEELMRVADLLVQLEPAVEPDVGFESRVMARLAAEGAFAAAAAAAAAAGAVTGAPAPAGPTTAATNEGTGRLGRPDRRSRAPRRGARPLLAAAAAGIVAVAGIAGMVAGRDSGLQVQKTAVNRLGARAVVVRADSGQSLCQLVAFPATGSQPARVVIHLDEQGTSPDSYQIFAQPSDGRPAVRLGSIALTGGHGTFLASVPAGTGPVDAVLIVDGPNTVKYRAVFAPI